MLISLPDNIFQNPLDKINMTIFEILYQLYGKGNFTFEDLEDFIQEILIEKNIENSYELLIKKQNLLNVLIDFQKLNLISKDNEYYILEDSIFKLFIELHLNNDILGYPTLKEPLQEIFGIYATSSKYTLTIDEFNQLLKAAILKHKIRENDVPNYEKIAKSWLLFSKHIVIIDEVILVNKLTKI